MLIRLHINLFYLPIIICSLILFSCASDAAKDDQNEQTSVEDAYWEDYSADPAKWGWVDTSGQIVISPQFDDARDFNEGVAPVNFKGKWGYIDRSGKWTIAPNYMEASLFHEGRAGVRNYKGKMGFISMRGDSLTPFRYLNLGNFKNGMAAVQTLEGWGYVSNDGGEVIAPQFTRAWPFETSNCARVKSGADYQLIDRRGKPVYRNGKEKIYAFSNGFYRFMKAGKWGILDTLGKEVLSPEYDRITPSSKGFYLAEKGNTVVLFPGMKTIEKPDGISRLKYIGEDRIRFYRDTLVGLLDTSGQEVLPPTYVQVNSFCNGLALCAKPGGDMWNWIRPDGTLLWPEDFPLAWDFYNGMARAIVREGFIVLNTRGKLVMPPKYQELRDFKEGLARFQALP